jgi:hypothetical protein
MKRKELRKHLETLQKSCEEALNGSWDKSDEGFQAMLAEIKQCITLTVRRKENGREIKKDGDNEQNIDRQD